MPDFVAPKGVPDYYPPVSRTFDAVRRTLLAARRFPARHVGNKYTVSLTELARWMVQR